MRHTQRASLVGHPDHVSNVCVTVAHSRPKSRRRAWKCPGECQMHYAQILGRRRPPHRKSRYRCASGAVTGRFPDLNRGFRNASQIARKGSRTVPYSHLISAISLTLLFNGRGPLHRWRRVCNRRRGPRRRLHSAPVAPRRNQVFAKVKRRSATTPYTHDARNTRRTTHAVPLAGKAWRQNLYTEVSWLHRGPAATAARP